MGHRPLALETTWNPGPSPGLQLCRTPPDPSQGSNAVHPLRYSRGIASKPAETQTTKSVLQASNRKLRQG